MPIRREHVVSGSFCLLVLTLLLTACSEKNPVAPEQPAQPEIFFNWLPAYLENQANAQPNHELMQFLDEEPNWKDPAAMGAILERLGTAPDAFQTGSGTANDAPILDAIRLYVIQAQHFLDGSTQYLPVLQRDRG